MLGSDSNNGIHTTDILGVDYPLELDCGQSLSNFVLAYEVYGNLNDAKDNAILICHALTGDQFVANPNPVTKRNGWWQTMVGPGKAIDTTKYFVICSNVLGGCMGSAGPASINPATQKLWGIDFPGITIGDMVKAQAILLDYLGIPKLYAVVGGSMGGMQVLEWLIQFPGRIRSVIMLATSDRQHVQNIAFHEVGRRAIMDDPDWKKGDYHTHGSLPLKGLALARMIGHITYLSKEKLNSRFGRQLQNSNLRSYKFSPDFQIESYLHHQGDTFTDRFDSNCYLYLTRAVDYFDQAVDAGGDLGEMYKRALSGHSISAGIYSFTSDWMYTIQDSQRIETALSSAGVTVIHKTFETEDGHDSFLLPNEDVEGAIRYFLSQIACSKLPSQIF